MRCDVAIVGAGVAGLSAMRALEENGIQTIVLEARDRIGGRIHTVRDPRLPQPIELGAEFVHGSAPELEEIAEEDDMPLFAIEGQRWRSRGGRLERLHDFWKRLHSVMRYLDSEKSDRSFSEFLDGRPGGRGAADARALAQAFVEGFHAADVRRISSHALAEGGYPGLDTEEQRQLRFGDGYDRVPTWLGRGHADRLRTRSVVERIEWEPGSVQIDVRDLESGVRRSVTARAAIVTVPLGVLVASADQAGAIEFSPAVPLLARAHECLAMGAVVRVILLFRERWWTGSLSSLPNDVTLESMSFLHGDAGDVKVWWSLHPARARVLIGWSGGTAAQRLSGLSADEVRERAVASLAANLGVTRRRVEGQLEGFWTHDWQEDPFSRGAYSYALVGGAEFAQKFARSVAGTLWFAGEASDAEGRSGTVHGAIGSGRAAARSVMRVLARG